MEILLLISLIVVLCLFFSNLFSRWGIPSLLVFVVLGMLFGSDGIFKIPLDNYQLVEQLCSVTLAFIMFYGGFGTNWKQAKPIAAKAIALSTLGVVSTALITSVFCYYVLKYSWLESFLVGSVISSTDAASVFSILRAKKLNLKDNTASLLEMESGSNDPASYMLTITAMSLINGSAGGTLLTTMFLQVVVGILVGLFVAWIGRMILCKRYLKIDGYGTLFVLSLVICSYAAATLLGGNGYLAVYLLGILLGNSPIVDKARLVHFFDGITTQAQIIIFFLLGLLSYPSRLPQIFLPSLGIAMFLTFVARPVSVYAILKPMGCGIRQILLVSFAGLRGAASIVFAIIAIVSGTELQRDLYHIVFSVSLLSVSFQGTLLPFVSRKLNMVDDCENVLKTFNDYQADCQLQLIEHKVEEGHSWIGKTIEDINVPVDVIAVMLIRGKENIVPKGNTKIAEADRIIFGGKPFIDTTAAVLEEVYLDQEHPWSEMQIRKIPLLRNELVVLIRHADNTSTIPHGDTILKLGDSLVVRRVNA